jgi:hypothetical protein
MKFTNKKQLVKKVQQALNLDADGIDAASVAAATEISHNIRAVKIKPTN